MSSAARSRQTAVFSPLLRAARPRTGRQSIALILFLGFASTALRFRRHGRQSAAAVEAQAQLLAGRDEVLHGPGLLRAAHDLGRVRDERAAVVHERTGIADD